MNPMNLISTIPSQKMPTPSLVSTEATHLVQKEATQLSLTNVMNLAIHVDAFYSLPSNFSTLNYITANVCMLIITIDKSKSSVPCVLIRLKWSSSTVLNHFKQS